jgi:uncharacterized protein YecT (DUF1311 family)
MSKISIAICTFLFSLSCHSQADKVIAQLDKEHQKCLDNGNNMANCSFEYYTKMDDLLNITYKKIRLDLSKDQQQQLKNLQIAWLKERDQYFKKVEKETAATLDGDNESQDYRMICSHENALFVKERIISLEKKYSKK